MPDRACRVLPELDGNCPFPQGCVGGLPVVKALRFGRYHAILKGIPFIRSLSKIMMLPEFLHSESGSREVAVLKSRYEL